MRSLTPKKLKMTREDPGFPGLLETLLVPYDTWGTCGAPQEAVDIAQEATRAGIPAGIAHHPIQGYFVIMAGQGPMIAWP